MKGKIYAICLIVAFFAASIVVFFAASITTWASFEAVIGFALALFLVPTFHELGHAIFALCNKFQVVYCKFFCCKFYQKAGKMRFALALPFTADETRFLPKSGENIKNRVLPVVSGGLIWSGALVALLLTPAVILLCFGVSAYILWGMLPYAAYVFLLNVVPAQYASGKTDMLVFLEIKQERAEGKAFLSAMELQGRLFSGQSYTEIPETLYETYALREDEPLYAVLWELKYRYFLEKGELEKAADALNRLIVASAYLTDEGLQSVQIEAAYMFLLQGDASQLKKLMERDEAILRSDDYRAKRLLATYAYACGEKKKGAALVAQAQESLEKESIVGVRKHELLLLSRLGA